MRSFLELTWRNGPLGTWRLEVCLEAINFQVVLVFVTIDDIGIVRCVESAPADECPADVRSFKKVRSERNDMLNLEARVGV